MALDAGLIITIAYFGVAIPLFSLLLIYNCIKFIKLSRKTKYSSTSYLAIKARRPIIIYLYILSILLITLVERPLTTYCVISGQCIVVVQYLTPVLLAFIVYGHFYIFLVRTWILYFEIHFNLAKKDIIWQKHLYLNYLSPSNKFNKSKQDWFLENRHTFGSPKWLFTKILCIPYTISCAISITIGVLVSYDHTVWYWLTNAFFLSFPVVCILIIWKNINPIYDFYRIRAELRVTLFLWVILCILLTVHLIVFEFILRDLRLLYQRIFYAVKLWEVGICLTINGLLSTAWICWHVKHKYFEYSQEWIESEMLKLQRTFENKSMIKRMTTKMIPFPSMVSPASSSGDFGGYNGMASTIIGQSPSVDMDSNLEEERSYNKSQSSKVIGTEAAEKIYSTFPLRDVLVTDIGFRLFMQHMTSEYSAESLLFLVEIVRYKYAMNGFKHIEMYRELMDDAEEAQAHIDDCLTWYMPLPASLLDDVVKPPDVDRFKSVSVEIQMSSTHTEDLDKNIMNGRLKHAASKPIISTSTSPKDPDSFSSLNFSKKRNRSTVGSLTSFNPLFHRNTNIDSEAKQDGTLNEIQEWDDAQIAWGTLSHALMIYEKYINFGALFEINISHRLRHKMQIEFDKLKKLYMDNHDSMVSGTLQDIMTGYAKFNDNIHIFAKYPEKRKELQLIFDETATRIEWLINDSYLRFRQTQTYHRLLKQLIKDRRKRSRNKDAFLMRRSSKKMSASFK